MIDADGEYFERVVDYVHLNPACAGLAGGKEGLEQYAWSSLADFTRPPKQRPQWLVAERVFSVFGLENKSRGRKAYLSRLQQKVQEGGKRRA